MRRAIGRCCAVLSLVLAATACATPQSESGPLAAKLVFLTTGECVNNDLMRANLDEALRELGQRSNYEAVDLDTLAAADVRRGYPTPTLLYENRDLFGFPEPQPPLPEPT